MTSRTDIVVIGAGAAGLSTTQALKKAGLQVRLLEKAHEIAAPWRARHPQLHLNTHRDLSVLPGLKMPKSVGAFPSRDELVRYLEDYARTFDLPVEFGVEVTALDRAGGGWRLETSAGEILARHVVIATGREVRPFMPDWPGRDAFEGELIHSADFGDSRRYAHKHVLVIGAGNSGSDVLNHLSRVETRGVSISIRNGSVVAPAYMFGLPLQRMTPLMEMMPQRAVDWMLADTQRMAFGDLTRFGFPREVGGAATRMATEGVSPAIDRGFVAAVKNGRMHVVPEVTGFAGKHVVLADGSRIAPDVTIAATGYRTGLEPLLGHLGVLDARGVPLINGAESLDHAPGFWCIGMRPTISGFLRAASRHGPAIAREIAADLAFGSPRRGLRAEESTPVPAQGAGG